VTAPKRPSKAAIAAMWRAYERELAAWRAEDRAHACRLVGYTCTGLVVWWILSRDPGGGRWTPTIMGLAVALAVGNIFEIRRGSDG
jgi:hypothetical protein